MRAIVLAVLLAASVALPAAAQQKQKPAAQPAPAAQAAPAAEGESLPEMDKLMAYVGTPEYFKALSTVVLGGEHDITPECKDAKALGRAGLTVLKLPGFRDGATVPATGLWKDQIEVDRCGPHVLHNVLVEGTPSGVRVNLLMPGLTGAPWDWQVDILQSAAEQAMKASGCKDASKVVIYDTQEDKMLEEIKADERGRMISGKWRETWTLKACGKLQPVSVTFTADGKGRATWESQAAAKKK